MCNGCGDAGVLVMKDGSYRFDSHTLSDATDKRLITGAAQGSGPCCASVVCVFLELFFWFCSAVGEVGPGADSAELASDRVL